jgi:hypothetical protein
MSEIARFLVAFFLFLCSSLAHAGDVYVQAPDEQGRVGLLFKGSMVEGDGEELEAALADIAKTQDTIPVTLDIQARFWYTQWVEPAMKMGEALRKYNTCVYAKACTGLCVVAFVGGRARYANVQPDGRLGPKFWFARSAAEEEHANNPTAQTQYYFDWLKRYMTGMTGDERFFQVFSAAPGYGQTGITLDQALNLGLLTAAEDTGAGACGKPIS